MNFVKGMMVGSIISAGVMWMCSESNMINTKKIMKKGKKLMKEIN